MAKFMTRVELHDANSDDYEILHRAMADREFYRQIQDEGSGEWYHLPPAQYHYKGIIEDRDVILNSVESACKETGKDYEITVTKSNGTIWTGLKDV